MTRLDVAHGQARADGLVSVFCDAPGWQGYDSFLQGAPATPPPANCNAALPFNIIYSSGTTGLPKGIVQTHRTRTHWAMFNAIEQGFKHFGIAPIGGQPHRSRTVAVGGGSGHHPGVIYVPRQVH